MGLSSSSSSLLSPQNQFFQAKNMFVLDKLKSALALNRRKNHVSLTNFINFV